MAPSPHYNSHAEQQAVLGCAAKLDPIKHPRRFALQQSRDRFTPPKRIHQPEAEKRTPELLEKAKTMTHLHISAAAREMGINRSVLDRLRNDYGLEFAKAIRPSHADRVRAAAPTVATMRDLAEVTGLKYLQVYNLCRKHGIALGGACSEEGQDPAGS